MPRQSQLTPEIKDDVAAKRAAGHTLQEIASEYDVTKVTVYRWLTEPETRRQVKAYTAGVGEMLLAKIARNFDQALDIQHRVMAGDETISKRAETTANNTYSSFISRMADIQLDDDE